MVTVPVQVLVLPEPSVTVSVTELAPILLQLKLELETVTVAMVQLSVLPPFRSLVERVAFPLPSRYKKGEAQFAVGARESCTVTVAVHEAAFPNASVAVKVTVLAPISLQVNADWERVLVKVVQASAVPKPIADAPITPFPVPSRVTVALLHTIAGPVTSCTVTEATQLLAFPDESVTVSVTDTVPRSPQLKVPCDTVTDRMPQLSVELAPITDAPITPFPVESNCTVALLQMADGETVSVTVTTEAQLEELPEGSVTAKVTETVPISLQVKLLVEMP
jgi:hypothetical protein